MASGGAGSERKLAEKRGRLSDRLLDEPAPGAGTDAGDTFVWGAKREKLLAQGADPLQLERENEARRTERLLELERIKAMRAERDAQTEQWEREKRRLELQAENWSYKEWLRDEKDFHMKQARERAEIRIREGRPKPIDILHKNLQVDTAFGFDARPPYVIFNGLGLQDLQELLEDIEMYLELSPVEMEFWTALRLLCQQQVALVTGKREPVPRDVLDVFAGQTLEGLRKLHGDIKTQMELGEDPEYWQTLEKQCESEIAQATLREIHAARLQARLALMEDEKRAAERMRIEEEVRARIKGQQQQQEQQQQAPPQPQQQPQQQQQQQKPQQPQQQPTSATKGERAPRKRMELVLEEVEEDDGGDHAAVDAGEVALQEARIRELEREARSLDLRAELLAGAGVDGELLTESEMLRAEMEKACEENEEQFADEVEQGSNKPTWEDRYVPRKPQFYNRVRTGYEWNKYNSTHYNKDNPPPKVVHGYRFNIFYNDLADPSRAPTYRLEPIPGNTDWAILRFQAGPPYLDLAFKYEQTRTLPRRTADAHAGSARPRDTVDRA